MYLVRRKETRRFLWIISAPVVELASAAGVLRYLALHLSPEEFKDLVEQGRLLVTLGVQDSIKAANKAALEGLN